MPPKKLQNSAEKAAKKAEKEAEKAAKKAEKDAEKAAKKAEKEAEKAAEKAAKKAEKEAEKAAKKAEKPVVAKKVAKKPVASPKKVAKKPVASPKKVAKKPVASPKKVAKKPVASPKKVAKKVPAFEKDLMIVLNYCITNLKDEFYEITKFMAIEPDDNIVLPMDKVRSGDVVRVILPNKYDKIVPLDENIRKMVVPWSEDSRFASIDGEDIILIASTETLDNIRSRLWHTLGDVLKKEKARLKKLKM